MHFPKHCAVWMTNMWGRGKNASDASWCVPSFRSLTPWLCITWHGSRGGLSHSSHWCGVHCCWTWLQSRLNHELSVNDWLLVFGYGNCNLNTEREKDAGNRCVVSRNTNSTSITNFTLAQGTHEKVLQHLSKEKECFLLYTVVVFRNFIVPYLSRTVGAMFLALRYSFCSCWMLPPHQRPPVLVVQWILALL